MSEILNKCKRLSFQENNFEKNNEIILEITEFIKNSEDSMNKIENCIGYNSKIFTEDEKISINQFRKTFKYDNLDFYFSNDSVENRQNLYLEIVEKLSNENLRNIHLELSHKKQKLEKFEEIYEVYNQLISNLKIKNFEVSTKFYSKIYDFISEQFAESKFNLFLKKTLKNSKIILEEIFIGSQESLCKFEGSNIQINFKEIDRIFENLCSDLEYIKIQFFEKLLIQLSQKFSYFKIENDNFIYLVYPYQNFHKERISYDLTLKNEGFFIILSILCF